MPLPHPAEGANGLIDQQKDKKVNKTKLNKPVPKKRNSFV